jgi:flagellar assembly protein FliH
MMRRLSAEAFEGTAGARAWSPKEGSNPAAAADRAPPQLETYRKAYLEGFEAGFEDGDKEARNALQEAQDAAHASTEAARKEQERWQSALAGLASQFVQAQKEHQAQMEALAVTIAYASVCRLVGRIHAENELVVSLCREALESMHLDPTQLRVAHSDRTSLEKSGLALPIVVDPGLQAGDCVIETPLGGVDASIELQLRALLQTLLDTLGRKE